MARLATLAIGLSLVDAAIPLPLPGVKPGLANIVILMVLARFGWRVAVWVSVLRVLAVSLLLGQFLTPGFFLSLSGTVCSLAMLGVAQLLPKRFFGLVSWSVLAALAHMAGQILLARFWLIPDDSVYRLMPILGFAAWGFGLLNGLVAGYLLSQLEKKHVEAEHREA